MASPLQVLLHIAQGQAVRPQQKGKGLQKDHHQHGGGHPQEDERHKVLGEQHIRLVVPLLGQVDGDEGGGAHGEQDRDGEQRVGEGEGQIDRAHGVLVHADGHHQTIHHGVEREHHQRGHRRRDEADELPLQAFS